GEDGIYWRWSEGGVEATAFALQALLTIDPENKLIEPVTHWLIKNRRGAHWSNTRDTAIAVLTLNDYLKTSGELDTDTEVELAVNGSSLIKTRFAEVLRAPSRFSVDPALLKDGTNEIQLRRTAGEGPIYFSVEGRYFSREEPVPAAGSEIFLRRQYFKLVGRPTLLKGWVYDKQPLGDGDRVKSGQRIETVITLETKNNAEYLVIEDLKPAGLEAVNVRSGEALYARELKSSALPRTFQESRIARSIERREPILFPSPENSPSDYTGRTRWVYQELRDRKVVLFLSDLPEGVWEIRYLLRAEVPGTFHALPVLGHAMYIPEIRANGAESRFTVEDRDD
ncbi:MAG: alpha-2-macroglobulin, partial [Nitrospinaceae bacterium]|nr:alpha-2-macroglobulin [Nitrospinaceae bacterium]NIR55901.1 alpha-2-macroglobulin [Nitrospinaceae bacterium]NIS86347.1 alpha-2-macroglobulin [Nitrospinaceae bacterium]NIT83183.1 alpha-2-macroglobulin [Nitrospinaceae bacterium]NIU43796.1 alpha-2-macroglobulin [Nitrospinaceae bacterium]